MSITWRRMFWRHFLHVHIDTYSFILVQNVSIIAFHIFDLLFLLEIKSMKVIYLGSTSTMNYWPNVKTFCNSCYEVFIYQNRKCIILILDVIRTQFYDTVNSQILYFRLYLFLPGLVCKRSRSDVAVEDTCSSCAEEFSSMVIESVLQVCSWMLPPLLRLWWPNWWPWWPLEWLLLPLLCRDIPKPWLPFLHDWNLTITKPITTVTRNRAVPTPANIVNAVVWFPDEWWPFSAAIFLVPSWTCSCFAMSSGMLDNGINSPLSLSTCVPSAKKIKTAYETRNMNNNASKYLMCMLWSRIWYIINFGWPKHWYFEENRFISSLITRSFFPNYLIYSKKI